MVLEAFAHPSPDEVVFRRPKTLIFDHWLGLDEAVVTTSGRRHSLRSCPMGWLERSNRRSARPKPLPSLPGADRAGATHF